MITAEQERAELTPQAAGEILEEVQDYTSPFVSMPW
jgi:hypothetical protein